MKCVRPWRLAKTYGNQIGCAVSELVVISVASCNRVDGGTAGGDDINELLDELGEARVVLAAVVLGNDGSDICADVVESVLDVRRPLGDSTGKGHSTGGEDGEDGGETHDERRFEKAERGWRC